tara:strand:+ start:45529 stop:45753 length:225 start_codon:yes stop_codon:yes gene_type:complete
VGSLDRKLKRKRAKEFAKSFKKTMKNFESVVRCVKCDRLPNVVMGEKIDNWHIRKESDKIQLTCPSCKEVEDVN